MIKIEIKKFINLAFVEAQKALDIGEVPIGSIIINKNKKIIGKGYNKTEKLSDPTAHAEIIAIQSATKKIKDWRLDDHIIFTTIQPCKMCMGAIIEARIQHVFYGSKNTKRRNKTKQIKSRLSRNLKCEDLLKKFFKSLR